MQIPEEEFAVKLKLPNEFITRALRAENYSITNAGKPQTLATLAIENSLEIGSPVRLGIESQREAFDDPIKAYSSYNPLAGSR